MNICKNSFCVTTTTRHDVLTVKVLDSINILLLFLRYPFFFLLQLPWLLFFYHLHQQFNADVGSRMHKSFTLSSFFFLFTLFFTYYVAFFIIMRFISYSLLLESAVTCVTYLNRLAKVRRIHIYGPKFLFSFMY